MSNVIILNLNKSSDKIAFISDVHWDNQTPSSRIDILMDTAKDKLKSILDICLSSNIKVIFFEGDIFNRVSVTHECVNELCNILLKFKDNNIRLFTILGNHDIIRNSADYLNKTPIQTLFVMKLLTHISLSSIINVCDCVNIFPVDYVERPIRVPESYKDSYNILLCHSFVNANEFMDDGKHNLTEKDIVNLGYNMIVAGHDHQRYPIMTIGNTLVVRHGSLLRGTYHDFNFERVPNIFVLNDLSNINESSVSEIPVRHKPYKDVVSNYVLNKKNEGTLSGLQDVLSNLAEKLTMSSEEDSDRILDIIKSDEGLPNDARLLILQYINQYA